MNTPGADDEDYVKAARASFDAEWSRLYRQMDEGPATADSPFTHYGAILTSLTSEFGRPIDVLDAGCGTGRYFHRLRNIRRLVGLDLSPDMIEQAKTPLHADKMQAQSVELICGEIGKVPLTAASFDFVYSVGVYGEYAPADDALLREFARLLRPDGRLFLTVVDSPSWVSVPENDSPSFTRRVVRKLFPHMPVSLRVGLNRTLSPFYVSRAQLDDLFARSQFTDVQITPYVHKTGWAGTHWHCTARKPPASEQSAATG